MPMNKGRICKGFGPALLFGSALVMGPALAADAVPGYALKTQPSICVSYDSSVPCTMAMAVSWTAPREEAVCLYEVGETEALHCWEPARSGSVELSYSDTEDVTYQLQALDGTVLATSEIKVINRDLRSSRNRRRHVWSIL